MMKLYWSPRSRSFSALWLMEETGQPYERVLTDISTGAQKTPNIWRSIRWRRCRRSRTATRRWRKPPRSAPMSPNAIREAKLAPPLGDPLRAKYLYWLFFAPGCIEPAMVQVATKIEMNPVVRRLGRRAAGVRRARRRAGERTVDARRKLLGRRYRDWIGAEFRGAAVQDGAVAPVVRSLHRSLRGAAGVPARRRPRGGVSGSCPAWPNSGRREGSTSCA